MFSRALISANVGLVLLILTLALGSAGPSPAQPAPAMDDFLGSAPTPVTGRPALEDEDMAVFIKVNDAAEPMRKQAVEDYFAALQKPDRQGGGKEAWAADFRTTLSGAMGTQADVDKKACEQAGVDYQKFQSLFQRIMQVRQLIEMEDELGSKRQRAMDFIASVEEKGVRQVAEEGFVFISNMERDTLEAHVLQEKEKSRRDAELRARKRVRTNENRTQKLGKMGRKDRKDQEKIETMRRIVAERRALLKDPVWEHRRADIEAEIKELEGIIEKLEPVIARRAQGRERTKAHLEGEPTRSDEIAEKLAAERLERAVEALRVYDEQKESGELLEKQIAQIEQELARNRESLVIIEEQMDRFKEDPVMQQALLDRPAVLRHADGLIVSGSSLIDMPPVGLRPDTPGP